MTSKGSVTALAMFATVLLSALIVLACCGEDDRQPNAPYYPTTTNTGTGSNTGGNSSTSSLGGAGGVGGATGGGELVAPADSPCFAEVAFWASGMAFMSPTPMALAKAFNQLAYDDSLAHPISIVLVASKPEQMTPSVGISATADNGSGLHVFPSGQKPEFVSATIGYGYFSTKTPQTSGYLHFRHEQGEVDIELRNLFVSAKTGSDCSVLYVTLDAVIPTSESNVALTVDGTATTIGELAGGAGGSAPMAWQLRAMFLAETITFDFGSLY